MKTYKYKINGNSYDVVINSVEEKVAEVIVNGVSYKVELDEDMTDPAAVSAPAVAAPSPQFTSCNPKKPAASSGKSVTSPLPGVILAVKVKEGDRVKVGQVVAILEAMKMENDIESEYDGVVTEVMVTKADSILEGEVIVKIS